MRRLRYVGRLAALLAGLWAGVLLGIGAVAAPAAFAILVAADAGRLVNRLFSHEAYLSLGAAVVLFAIERQRSRDSAAAGTGSVFSANLMLILGTLFCTVAGYFAIQPMMAAARAGEGSVSFLTLHALSAGMYALKGLLVLALAWRLTSVNPTATTS